MSISEKRYKRSFGKGLDGSDLAIQYITLQSDNPGKKVYIQSGMHGGEVTIWVIRELYKKLRSKLESGEITFVPLANPIAWTQRSYFSTNGKFDFYMGKDWNRNFPGSVEGTLGERIAHELFQSSILHDFCVDLHTSRSSFPFCIVGDESDLQYSKISGLEYTFFLNFRNQQQLGKYSDSLLGQLSLKTIPNITFECGSHDSYEQDYVSEIVEGILRILSSFEMFNFSTQDRTNSPKYYTKINTYRSPQGGFAMFNKRIGESFKEGDLLFSIINPANFDKPFKVHARENGIVQKISPTYIYWPGDDVMECLFTEDIRVIA